MRIIGHIVNTDHRRFMKEVNEDLADAKKRGINIEIHYATAWAGQYLVYTALIIDKE